MILNNEIRARNAIKIITYINIIYAIFYKQPRQYAQNKKALGFKNQN